MGRYGFLIFQCSLIDKKALKDCKQVQRKRMKKRITDLGLRVEQFKSLLDGLFFQTLFMNYWKTSEEYNTKGYKQQSLISWERKFSLLLYLFKFLYKHWRKRKQGVNSNWLTSSRRKLECNIQFPSSTCWRDMEAPHLFYSIAMCLLLWPCQSQRITPIFLNFRYWFLSFSCPCRRNRTYEGFL